MLYTFDLIVRFLENYNQIEAFIERTTNELFPIGYDYETSDDFWKQEGNTLLDKGSHNTRVPKRDNLKENLIVMKADIDKAIKLLTVAEQIAIWYSYQLVPYNTTNRKNAATLAQEGLGKVVDTLNDG